MIINSVRLCYIAHQGESDFSQIDEQLVNQWLSELSSVRRSSVLRLVHRSDRITSLLAARLLMICAQLEGIDAFRLSEVQYPDPGKPCWQSKSGDFFDFNISHSDKLIAVAASKTMKVGIDAEKIRELKNLNFKMVLSADELMAIQQTPDLFFELWSKKEAVVKAANTSGLGRMRDVQLKRDYALLDDMNWYLSNIELNESLTDQYAIHLATSMPVDEVIMKQIVLSDLISH
jgi:4'-phosphopantetheinyl transferase